MIPAKPSSVCITVFLVASSLCALSHAAGHKHTHVHNKAHNIRYVQARSPEVDFDQLESCTGHTVCPNNSICLHGKCQCTFGYQASTCEFAKGQCETLFCTADAACDGRFANSRCNLKTNECECKTWYFVESNLYCKKFSLDSLPTVVQLYLERAAWFIGTVIAFYILFSIIDSLMKQKFELKAQIKRLEKQVKSSSEQPGIDQSDSEIQASAPTASESEVQIDMSNGNSSSMMYPVLENL